MPIFNNILMGASAQSTGDFGDEITRSFRFPGNSSNMFKRSSHPTPTGTGSLFSVWIKKPAMNNVKAYQVLISQYGGSPGYFVALNSSSTNDSLRINLGSDYIITPKQRDSSAWYHIFIVSNQAGTSTHINGQLVDRRQSFDNKLVNSGDVFIGNLNQSNGGWGFEGYMAELYYLDGHGDKRVTDFGRYNDQGIWVPKTPENLSYGAAGFYLPFDPAGEAGETSGDGAAMGADHSGNNNHFNNLSGDFDGNAVSSSNFDNDVDYNDTPTNNHCTIVEIDHQNTGAVRDAGLRFGSNSNGSWQATFGSMELTSGKWYWEVQSVNGNEDAFGVSSEKYYQFDNRNYNNTGDADGSYGFFTGNGSKYIEGAGAASYSTGGSANDIYGIAFDADIKAIWISRNGTWLNSATASEIAAGTTTNAMAGPNMDGDRWRCSFSSTMGTESNMAKVNFGQRNFIYTPPSGFKAVCTNNLAKSNFPHPDEENFDVLEGPGSGGALVYKLPVGTVTDRTAALFDDFVGVAGSSFTSSSNSDGFIIDFLTAGTGQRVIRSQSGGYWGSTTVQCYISETGAEYSWTQVITNQAFHVSNENTVTITAQSNPWRYAKLVANTNSSASWATSTGADPILTRAKAYASSGMWWIKDLDNSQSHQIIDSVTVADEGSDKATLSPGPGSDKSGFDTYAAPSGNCIAYCWKYNSSSPSTNGFEIIRYSGDGSTSRDISHNLGAVPKFAIFTSRSSVTSTGIPMRVFHGGANPIGQQTGYELSDSTGANNVCASSRGGVDFNNTTASVLRLCGSSSAMDSVNNGGSSNKYTVYLWTEKEGFSRFSAYKGTGNAHGPYVHCGFKPAFILIRSCGGSEHWRLYDSKRHSTNLADTPIFPNLKNAESASESHGGIDFTANGFKIRTSNSGLNLNNEDFIFAAFAENPFGGSNSAPAAAH